MLVFEAQKRGRKIQELVYERALWCAWSQSSVRGHEIPRKMARKKALAAETWLWSEFGVTVNDRDNTWLGPDGMSGMVDGPFRVSVGGDVGVSIVEPVTALAAQLPPSIRSRSRSRSRSRERSGRKGDQLIDIRDVENERAQLLDEADRKRDQSDMVVTGNGATLPSPVWSLATRNVGAV